MGAAKASRMRQLQADQQVARRAESIAMGRDQCFQERRQARTIARHTQSLPRIGAGAGVYGGRFSAPDELGAAQTKMPPPPES